MESVDIICYGGDHKNINLTITDCNSNPLNLSGVDILFTVRYGSYLALQKTIDEYLVAESGMTSITISGNDWENIIQGKYFYDIQITDELNQKYTALTGNFIVSEDISY